VVSPRVQTWVDEQLLAQEKDTKHDSMAPLPKVALYDEMQKLQKDAKKQALEPSWGCKTRARAQNEDRGS
jgi:hypothetical protein